MNVAIATPRGENPDDGNGCPSCAWMMSAAEQYPADVFPTIARSVELNLARHLASGECLAEPDDDQEPEPVVSALEPVPESPTMARLREQSRKADARSRHPSTRRQNWSQ
ncbi:hypothetical protein AB0D10_31515 [Kitasatospora sp. NPDC048545]|uniref:hypothetical protein n=1 Tax=Kitasatospora sp. NPDC048545 TaxID=3157208 RepID=UPI0033E938FB